MDYLLGADSPFAGLVAAEKEFINTLVAASGFEEDKLKTVLCMLVAYPLGFIFKALPNSPKLKNLTSIILGVLFCVYTLGRWSWVHLFVSSLVAYLLMAFTSPKVSHKLVFVWAMGYITVSHIYRLYTDYLGWTLDFTGPQMLLTLKLTSMGWNYHDGVATDAEKATQKASQRAASINKLPSLLEYYGWVYFFPSLLAGPAIEIKDYQSYIDLSMYKSVPANKGRKQEDYIIPSALVPTLLVFLRTIVVAVGFIIGATFFPPSTLVSAEFAATPIYLRILILHAVIMLVRYKYYFAWVISEGACVATGMGYNGLDKDGKMLFDRCNNVQVLKIEFAQNIRDMSTYWNMGTASWLRKCIYSFIHNQIHFFDEEDIYERVPSNSFPLLATYVTSAFWHGFYPGYYLFFLTGGVLTEIAREGRRRIRPYFVTVINEKETPRQPGKLIYDVVGMINTQLALSYSGCAFILLSWEASLQAWSAFHYSGHIALALAFIFTRVLPAPKSKSVKKTE